MKDRKRGKEKFTIEYTADGFSAFNEDGTIYTVAKDKDELVLNIIEAANLHYAKEGVKDEISREHIEMQMDFKEFFKRFNYLKASAIAKRAGINASLVSQYVKGIKQPSEKQTAKILRSIREIGSELSSISF